MGLHGPATGLAEALQALRLGGAVGAGLQCLFSLYVRTVLYGCTVCKGMLIAYGLAYGLDWAEPALSVWLSGHGGLLAVNI